MKRSLWIFLLLVSFSVACAHRTAQTPPPAPVAVISTVEGDDPAGQAGLYGEKEVFEGFYEDIVCDEESPAVATSDTAQEPLDEGAIEAEFLDEDLDFLEEEDAEAPVIYVSDPLAPWNRLMFQFNDKLYFWFLKPVSTGYKAVVPGPVRSGVQNFFTNLAAPIRMGSCMVQGKGAEAQAEFARFMFNTTFGILGIGAPSEQFPHLKKIHDEDMGQALAARGVDNGFYIVWPILGPSTLRDTAGTVGDVFMNPISYFPLAASVGMTGEKKMNEASYRVGDYEALREASLDPYEAVRDAYIQYRAKKVEE